jgi:ATP-binding cassette, subfamily G (WHITE), member 1
LNVLSGFENKNVTGEILIENQPLRKYMRNVAYVMQEVNLEARLTVEESISFAIKMKTGNALDSVQKYSKIRQLLMFFNLTDKKNSYVKSLSGGERKRLSIALEIVDDPKILFLDEPLTHIDSYGAMQCVRILRDLTKKGHTVICSIHQPSTLMCEYFHQLYFISNGHCVYQGDLKNLIIFFKEINLPCCDSHNPVDHLMDIAVGCFGNQENILVKLIENGKNQNFRSSKIPQNNNELNQVAAREKTFIPTFAQNLKHLLQRNIKIVMRDKFYISLRILMHLLIAIFVCGIYGPIGNEATQVFRSSKIPVIGLFCIMYSSCFASVMISK